MRDGVSRQILRKLRRGHWVVQDQLDLHGLNRAEAHEALAAVPARRVATRAACVRIVHGKGLGSKNREPVLKGKVKRLARAARRGPRVLPGAAAQGGAGRCWCC